jgi:hypothetical protein
VASADAAPTEQEYEVFTVLDAQLAAQLKIWEEVQAKDLAALNDLVREGGVPLLQIAPAKAAGGNGSTQ